MSKYWKRYWDEHARATPDSQPLRQVLRVKEKREIDLEVFSDIANYISQNLKIEPDHKLLDLCCGNGLLSEKLATQCEWVTSVDFSSELVKCIQLRNTGNITGISADVLTVKFPDKSFNGILFAAALQHFTQQEVMSLFISMAKWLQPDGRLLITDVLDQDKMWCFFNNTERVKDYFQSELNSEPILGTWFKRCWIEHLALFAGFSKVLIIDQPENFPYSHYRFDVVCSK